MGITRFRAKPSNGLAGTLAAAAAIASAAVLAIACRPDRAEVDPMGPNAACYVCHMTFLREELSLTHLKAKVGCIRCHGTSAAHANDEDVGATKPDVCFQRPQVNPFCRTCHPSHDVAPEKVLARWQELRAANGARHKATGPVACTDCHGRHKIAKSPQ